MGLSHRIILGIFFISPLSLAHTFHEEAGTPPLPPTCWHVLVPEVTPELEYHKIQMAFKEWKQAQQPVLRFYTRLIDRAFDHDRKIFLTSRAILNWITDHPHAEAWTMLAHRLFQELIPLYPPETEEIRNLTPIEDLWVVALSKIFESKKIPASTQVDLLFQYPIENFLGTPLMDVFPTEKPHPDLLDHFFERLTRPGALDATHGQYVFLITVFAVQHPGGLQAIKVYLHDHSLLRNTEKSQWPKLLENRISRIRVVSELFELFSNKAQLGPRAILALALREFRDPTRPIQPQLKRFWEALTRTLRIRNTDWVFAEIPNNGLDLHYSGGENALVIRPDGTLFRAKTTENAETLPPRDQMKEISPVSFIDFLNPLSEQKPGTPHRGEHWFPCL